MSNEAINKIFMQEATKDLADEQITTNRELIKLILSPAYIEDEFEHFIHINDDLPDFEDGTLELLNSTKEAINEQARWCLYKRTENDLYNHGTGAFNDEGNQTGTLDYADVKDIVETAPLALFLMKPEFYKDTELQKIHLAAYPEHYTLCNSEIRSDKKYSQSIFKLEPHQIVYASEEIRNDLKTALICMKADPSSIHMCGSIPEGIVKQAGYGQNGIEALKRAIKSEELHNSLQKSVKNKPPTQQLIRKL